MIQASEFLVAAYQGGFTFYTGVPCTFLAPLINRAIRSPTIAYVGATSEGEAVAIAAGAWLAGRSTVVLCQNSGLGNTVNPLTSLNWPFCIPTLLVVTWRGHPGDQDEPQHTLMGQITTTLLDLMQVSNRLFPVTLPELTLAITDARISMARYRLPFAFVMVTEPITSEELDEMPLPIVPPPGIVTDICCGTIRRPTRAATLECLLCLIPDKAAVIATTGKCGRELFTIADRSQHFYQVGSMGGASAIGLGVALNTNCPVVILDGDGAALMKMGNLATIGAQAPHNLIHILLDNGVHDSTGGQATASASVSFSKVAGACGYATATVTDNLRDFEEVTRQALIESGPHMIHLYIRPGSMPTLGRPTMRPIDVANRFKDFLAVL